MIRAMRKGFVPLAALLSLLAIVPGCGGSTTASVTTGWHAGNIAPGFSLFNLHGEKVSLESFRGQPVMVNFWATD